MHDQTCFFCQQSAEKYLKALMEEVGLAIPRTHNLPKLESLVAHQFKSLYSLRRGLDFLTRFAVETRYPGESASKRETSAALRWASRVRTKVRSLLGLPLEPKRKPKP